MTGLERGHDNRYLRRSLVNGSFQESFNALVTSNGTTVTLTLTNTGGDNFLTMSFSDAISQFDVTSATIALTAGSDSSPTVNYIYVLQSDKTQMTKSTSDWPTAEHIKIAYLLVQSATGVQTDSGAYVNHNWNDHLQDTNNIGHIIHLGERERATAAQWFKGVSGNGTDGYLTPTAGNVELKLTSGVIYQMHRHDFPAFDTSSGNEVLVKNWSGDAFHRITNLYDITADSTGATIGNNKYFNLILWGVGNEENTFHPMMVNLPGGFYNTQAAAEQDIDAVDDFIIPREFDLDSTTGFLIARITIQMKTGGGTWVVKSTVDLRGNTPNTASGGVGSVISEFHDNAFIIVDEADESKELAFDVGTNVSTGTTRTLKIADENGTIAIAEGAYHDGFSDFVANEHIDHSGVSITAGSGISGGGDLTTTRTLDLDINSLSVATIAAGDFVPFWDITATATNKKVTFANFEGTLDHGNLAGLADDDHTQYILVGGTRAFTGEQSMGTNKLTNVLDPTANQDVATKKYVDDNDFWDRTGTILSPKTAGDDISLQFGDFVSEQNPDAVNAIRMKATSSDADIVIGDGTGYFNVWNVTDANPTDNIFNVRNNGDVVITGHLDMSTNKILNVVDPTSNQEAATKKYVDDKNVETFPTAIADKNIPYSNGTVLVSSANFVFDDGVDPGKLGIGIGIPTDTLDVNGGARIRTNLGIGAVGNSAIWIEQSNPILQWINTAGTVGKKGIRLAYDNDRLTFQRTNDTGTFEANYLALDQDTGRMSLGTLNTTAMMSIDQSDGSAAIPVLFLDQGDPSEEMIEFATTIGTGNAIEAVGGKSLTTTHFIKVTIPGGLTRYIPVGTIA